MTEISSKQAKQTIAENEEIILEKKQASKDEPSRLKRNLINTQIKNRETVNKSLQQFVK